MTDGADDSDLLTPGQPDADGHSLDAYSEDDDVVTRQVEGLLVEPRWLVQFTSLDRRLMQTPELVAALLSGAISRETLVWRGGMDDWSPIGRLDVLSPSAIPTLPPQRHATPSAPIPSRRAMAAQVTAARVTAAPATRAKPLELTLAAVAIALSAAAITTSVLSIAGVFDAHEGPRRVQALRAAPTKQAPPPSDSERATAVAH